MVKWPFRRNRTEDSVPQEIQEYYQSEKRERVGVAWMLALATLVVTVLLALGIFYGGRWAYRAVFDDDKNENTPTEQEQRQDQSQDSERTNEPTTLPGDDSDNDGQQSSSEAEDTPLTTPQTGPLPATGPSDNL